jgi:hypothetical protein
VFWSPDCRVGELMAAGGVIRRLSSIFRAPALRMFSVHGGGHIFGCVLRC